MSLSPLRLAILVPIAAALLTTSPAGACMREMPVVVPSGHVEPRTPAIALREAEELVERGVEDLPAAIVRTREAKAMLEADPEHPLAEDVIRELSASERRAKTARLLARASMLEGLARSRAPGATAREREGAAAAIAAIAAEHDTLVTEGTLAEVFARVPAREADASGRFRSLARRDLLGGPWENAAYANLAAKAGDEATERAQRSRCRQLTSAATTHGICDAPLAEPTAAARVAVASAGGTGLAIAAALGALVRRARARRLAGYRA